MAPDDTVVAPRTRRGHAVLIVTNTAIGPGKLVLVVGPSGAGKDTLLGLAKSACADDKSIVFARRVVTREASSAEDNEPMSADAFREAQARGAFAIHWEAHGHAYGLPRGIEDDIRAGRTVVANVSRTVISALRHANSAGLGDGPASKPISCDHAATSSSANATALNGGRIANAITRAIRATRSE